MQDYSQQSILLQVRSFQDHGGGGEEGLKLVCDD